MCDHKTNTRHAYSSRLTTFSAWISCFFATATGPRHLHLPIRKHRLTHQKHRKLRNGATKCSRRETNGAFLVVSPFSLHMRRGPVWSMPVSPPTPVSHPALHALGRSAKPRQRFSVCPAMISCVPIPKDPPVYGSGSKLTPNPQTRVGWQVKGSLFWSCCVGKTRVPLRHDPLPYNLAWIRSFPRSISHLLSPACSLLVAH